MEHQHDCNCGHDHHEVQSKYALALRGGRDHNCNHVDVPYIVTI